MHVDTYYTFYVCILDLIYFLLCIQILTTNIFFIITIFVRASSLCPVYQLLTENKRQKSKRVCFNQVKKKILQISKITQAQWDWMENFCNQILSLSIDPLLNLGLFGLVWSIPFHRSPDRMIKVVLIWGELPAQAQVFCYLLAGFLLALPK